MNVLWQDTLFGLRMLAKKPAFTFVAALALGIGLNTPIFALIDTILLGSPSFREPDRVVAIWSGAAAVGEPRDPNDTRNNSRERTGQTIWPDDRHLRK